MRRSAAIQFAGGCAVAGECGGTVAGVLLVADTAKAEEGCCWSATVVATTGALVDFPPP